MNKYLENVSKWISRGTAVLAALCLLIMVFSLLDGVFFRYVLNASLTWSDEVAVLAFSWSIFLFSSVMVQEQGHVRITLLLSALPRPLEVSLEKISCILVLLFGALMVWAGWQFVGFTATQVSPALRYPLWLQTAAIPVSGALIVLHSVVLLFQPVPAKASEEKAS